MRLLAYGAEVAADPGLLGAFRDAHSSGTLIVHCPPTAPGLAEAVERRVLDAGLDGDDGVEIVILAVPDDSETRAAIDRSVTGVFTRQPSFLLLTYDSCRYDVMRDARTPVLDRYASEVLPGQTPANFTYAAHHAFFAGMLPHVAEPRPYYNRFVRQLWRRIHRKTGQPPRVAFPPNSRNMPNESSASVNSGCKREERERELGRPPFIPIFQVGRWPITASF